MSDIILDGKIRLDKGDVSDVKNELLDALKASKNLMGELRKPLRIKVKTKELDEAIGKQRTVIELNDNLSNQEKKLRALMAGAPSSKAGEYMGSVFDMIYGKYKEGEDGKPGKRSGNAALSGLNITDKMMELLTASTEKEVQKIYSELEAFSRLPISAVRNSVTGERFFKKARSDGKYKTFVKNLETEERDKLIRDQLAYDDVNNQYNNEKERTVTRVNELLKTSQEAIKSRIINGSVKEIIEDIEHGNGFSYSEQATKQLKVDGKIKNKDISDLNNYGKLIEAYNTAKASYKNNSKLENEEQLIGMFQNARELLDISELLKKQEKKLSKKYAGVSLFTEGKDFISEETIKNKLNDASPKSIFNTYIANTVAELEKARNDAYNKLANDLRNITTKSLSRANKGSSGSENTDSNTNRNRERRNGSSAPSVSGSGKDSSNSTPTSSEGNTQGEPPGVTQEEYDHLKNLHDKQSENVENLKRDNENLKEHVETLNKKIGEQKGEIDKLKAGSSKEKKNLLKELTVGQKYIKDNGIQELAYEEAVKESMKELRSMGINSMEDFYKGESNYIYDNPIYPANAELYDEFSDKNGYFDTEEFFGYIAKRIESENEEIKNMVNESIDSWRSEMNEDIRQGSLKSQDEYKQKFFNAVKPALENGLNPSDFLEGNNLDYYTKQIIPEFKEQIESIAGTQLDIDTSRMESKLENTKEEVNEIQNVIKGDSVSGSFYHGSKKQWDSDSFDMSKSGVGRAAFGTGMYFTTDSEKVSNFGSKTIKELSGSIDGMFVITKDYITDIADLYKAMGTAVPDDADIKRAVADMRNFNQDKESRDQFRQNMLSMGYNGVFVGDNLNNKIMKEELVIYNEELLKNILSRSKEELKNISSKDAELLVGDNGKRSVTNPVVKDNSFTQENLDETKEKSKELQEEVAKPIKLDVDNSEANENIDETIEKKKKLDEIQIHPVDSPAPSSKPTGESSNENYLNEPFLKDLSGDIAKEDSKLGELAGTLDRVTQAIANKTDEFEKEGQVVAGVVQEEITALETLDGQIILIEGSLKNLAESFDSLMSEAIQKFYDSFENNDFNLEQKLFGENKNGTPVIIDNSKALAALREIINEYNSLVSHLNNPIPLLLDNSKSYTSINEIAEQSITLIKYISENPLDLKLNISDAKSNYESIKRLLEELIGLSPITINVDVTGDFNTITDGSFIAALDGLKGVADACKEIKPNSFKNLSESLKVITEKDTFSSSLDKVVEAINKLRDATSGNFGIIEELKALSNSSNLKDLAKVLSASKANMSRAKRALTTDEERRKKEKEREEARKLVIKENQEKNENYLLNITNEEEKRLADKLAGKYHKFLGGTKDDSYAKVQKTRINYNGEMMDSFVYTGKNGNQLTLGRNGNIIGASRDFEFEEKQSKKDIKTKKKEEDRKFSDEAEGAKRQQEALAKIEKGKIEEDLERSLSLLKEEYSIREKIEGLSVKSTEDVVKKNHLEEDLTKNLSEQQRLSEKMLDYDIGQLNYYKQLNNYDEEQNKIIKEGNVSLSRTVERQTGKQIDNQAKEREKQAEKKKREEERQQREYEKSLEAQKKRERDVAEREKEYRSKEFDKKTKERNDRIAAVTKLFNDDFDAKDNWRSLNAELNDSIDKAISENDKISKEMVDKLTNAKSVGTDTFGVLNGETVRVSADNYKEIAKQRKEYVDSIISEAKREQKEKVKIENQEERNLEREIAKEDKAKEKAKKDADSISKKYDVGDYSTKLRDNIKNASKYDLSTDAGKELIGLLGDTKTAYDDLATAVKKYKDDSSDANTVKVISEQEKLQEVLDITKNKLKEINDIQGATSNKGVLRDILDGKDSGSIIKKIDEYYSESGNNEIDKIKSELLNKNIKDGLVDEINNTYKKIQKRSTDKDKIANFDIWEKRIMENADSAYFKLLEDIEDIDFSNINTAKLDELIQKLQELKTVEQDMNSSDLKAISQKDILDVDAIFSKIESRNTKAAGSKQFRARFEEIRAAINSLNETSSQFDLDNIRMQITSLQTDFEKAGMSGKSFVDTWKSRMTGLVTWLTSFVSFYDVINKVREGIEIIKELDADLVEMQKVSDESLSSLKNYQLESFDIASGVGTNSSQIQQSTADWMRLGESLEEAKKSAAESNILLNVSEFQSIDEATESLVVMSAAYKDLDKMEIIDKLNNIGNNFSISTDGIASALQRSASALVTANNDIDEAIALITAGNAVVQDPESVGAGMKMIALRIQGTEEAKAELEAMGEDVEGYIVGTASKIDESVRNFTAVASNGFQGISVLDENGNYRSTYQILQDIADIYGEIQATDKQYGTNHEQGLLELLAGKNRSNIAASILQNGDILRDVYESSQHSEGSALEENEKYMNSIAGKLQELQNQIQKFASLTINSDMFKGLIDGANQLLGLVNDLLETFGLFPVAMAGFGGFEFYKNFEFLKDAGKFAESKNIIKDLDIFGGNSSEIDKFVKELNKQVTAEYAEKLLEGLDQDNDSVIKAINSSVWQGMIGKHKDENIIARLNSESDYNKFSKIFKQAGVGQEKAKELLKSSDWAGMLDDIVVDATNGAEAMNLMEVATVGLAEGEVVAAGTTSGLGLAFEGLAQTIAANIAVIAPWAIAIAGVGAALYLLYKHENRFNDSLKESKEAFSEYEAAFSEAQDIRDKIDSISEARAELEEKSENGTITLAEEGQLHTLELQTAELERQLALKEQLENKAKEDSVAAAKKTLKMDTVEDLTNPLENYVYVSPDQAGSQRYGKGDIIEVSKKYVEKIDELKKKSRELLKNGSPEELAENEGEIEKYTEALSENVEKLQGLREQLSDPITGLKMDGLDYEASRMYDEITNILDGFTNIGKTAEEIVNDSLNKLFSSSDKGMVELKQRIIEAYQSGGDLSSILSEVGINLKSLDSDQVEYVDKYFQQMAKHVDLVAQKLNLVSLDVFELANDENSALSKMIEAFSGNTKEKGDYYNDVLGYITSAEELYKNGDIGTEKFKAIAKFFSPNGFEDEENWAENLPKIKRYFTEDNSGAKNFLADLISKGYASKDKNGVYTVDDFIDADALGKQLGMGAEAVTVMLGNLMDKGLADDLFTNETEGFATLTSLQEQYAQKQREINELEASGAKQSVIDDKKKELEELDDRIKNVTKSIDDMFAAYDKGGKDGNGKFMDEAGAKDYLQRYNSLNNQYLSSSSESERNGWKNNGREELAAAAREYAKNNGLEVGFNKRGQAFYGTDADKVAQAVEDSNKKLDAYADAIKQSNDDLINKYISDNGLTVDGKTMTVEQFKEAFAESNWIPEDELANFGNAVSEEAAATDENTSAINSLTDAINALIGVIDPNYRHNQSNEEQKQEQREQKKTSLSANGKGQSNEDQRKEQNYDRKISQTVTLDVDDSKYEEKKDEVENDHPITEVEFDVPDNPDIPTGNGTGIEIPVSAETGEAEKNLSDFEGKADEANGKEIRTFFSLSGITEAAGKLSNILRQLVGLNGKTYTTTYKVNHVTNYSTGKSASQDNSAWNHRYNGTLPSAFASGSSNVNSDGTLKKDETALINELGTEGIVRNGKLITYNDGYPTFANLQHGDVVLNHKQMEQLRERGYVRGSHARLVGGASAFATGSVISNAYALKDDNLNRDGSGGGTSSSKKSDNKTKKSENKNTKAKDKNTKATNKNSDAIDWVSRKLTYLGNATKKIADKITDYITSALKDSLLKKQIQSVGKEIEANQKAAAKYKSKADGVNLDAKYKKKVREGTIDLENVKSEKTRNAIQEYQDYYDKMVQCQQATQSLINTQVELFAQWMNMPTEEAEKKIERLTRKLNLLKAAEGVANSGGSAMAAFAEIGSKMAAESGKAYADAQEKYDSANADKVAKKQAKQDAKDAKTQADKDLKAKKKKLTKDDKKRKKNKDGTYSLKGVKKGSAQYNRLKDYNDALKASKSAESSSTKADQAYKDASSNATKANDALQAARRTNDYVNQTYRFNDYTTDTPAYVVSNALLDEEVEVQREINEARQKALKESSKRRSDQLQTKEKAQKSAKKAGRDILDNSKYSKKLSDSQKKALKEGKEVSTKGIKDKKLKKELDSYNKKVQNATIEANNYRAAIESQEEAMVNAAESAAELAQMQVDAEVQKFNNIKDYYESEISYLQAINDLNQKQLDLKKRQGKVINAEDYSDMRENLEEQRKYGEEEVEILQKQFDESVASGKIQPHTKEYNDLAAALANAKGAVIDLDIALLDLEEDIVKNEIDKLQFQLDQLSATTDRLQDELEIKEMQGLKATAADYQELIAASKEEQVQLRKQIEYLKQLQSEQDEGSEKWMEYQREINGMESQIRQCTKDQIQWNQAIADLPMKELEEAISLLSKVVSYYESIKRMKISLGQNVTAGDYRNQINALQQQISKETSRMNTARQNMMAAQSSEDGTYNGHDAAYYEDLYYDAATNINNLKADIGDLQHEIDRIPVNKLITKLDELAAAGNKVKDAMTLKETTGFTSTVQDYEALIANSKLQQTNLQQQNAELTKLLAKYEEGSQLYVDTKKEILDNESAIRQAGIEQEEWNNAILNLPLTKLQNMLNLLEAIAEYNSTINELLQAMGYDLKSSDYDKVFKDQNDKIANLLEERAIALDMYQKAMANGGAYAGKSADDWQAEYKNLGAEINSTRIQIEELKDTMREDIEFRGFNRLFTNMEHLRSDLEVIRAAIDDEDLYDKDTGELTDKGYTAIAVAQQQLKSYQKDIETANAMIARIESMHGQDGYSEDEYVQDLMDAESKLISALEGQKDAREEIKSLIEDSVDLELDSVQKLIDKWEKLLDAQKEIYDYGKNIKKQAQEVANLEKQLMNLQGDDSEENKARIQQLKVSYEDAKDALYETEFDHYISEQKKLVNELMDDWQEHSSEYIDHIVENMTDMTDRLDTHVDILEDIITDYTVDFNDEILTSTGTIATHIEDAETDITDEIEESTDESTDEIVEEMNKGFGGIFEWFRMLLEKFGFTIDGGDDSILTNGAMSGLFGDFFGMMSGDFNSLSGIMSGGFSGLGGNFDILGGLMNGNFSGLENFMGGNFSELFSKGGNWCNSIGGFIGTSGNGICGQIKDSGDSTDDQISDTGHEIGDAIEEAKQDITTSCEADFNALKAAFEEYIGKYGGQIDNSLVRNTDKYQELAEKWGARLNDNIQQTINWLKDINSGIRQSISSGSMQGVAEHAKGTKKTLEDISWTNENGKGEIIRRSDGAILTPVGKGGMVFDNAASQRLWDLAHGEDGVFLAQAQFASIADALSKQFAMPTGSSDIVNNGGNITISNLEIVLPDVQNPEQFAEAFQDQFYKILTTKKGERAVQSVTTDRLTGGSTISKYKR